MTTHVDYHDGHAEELLDELARLSEDDPRHERIRNELVALHTPIARHIARRYAHGDEPVEDLEQAAMLGLVKAMNRFDPTLGTRFLAYAMPTMTGEVKRHFRDQICSVRMPRRLQELRLRLRAARQDFTHEHGRSPTVPEIAARLDISEEETIEVLSAAEAYRPASLDVPVGADEGSETLADLLGDDDPAYEDIVDKIAVRPVLDELPTRERTILLHRFFGNKTQSEIAELVGVSQMHVSRLINRTLRDLRTTLLDDTGNTAGQGEDGAS
jgi:RNA polymerase sigma-B factor